MCLRAFLVRAALAAAVLWAPAPAASQQEPTDDAEPGPRLGPVREEPAPGADTPEPAGAILVIDFQGVLRDSRAARRIQDQVAGLRTAYQEEFGAVEEELRRLEADLTEQRETLDANAFEARRREFEQRITEAQRAAQARRATLDRALDSAMGQVRSTLLDIVADIARDRRARLVITKGQVVLADRSIEISAEARSRLDERLPTVEVEMPAGAEPGPTAPTDP